MTRESPRANPAALRVALLTNFVPPYRIPVFHEIARRAAAFRVLISTSMEPDRFWAPETGGLDVRVQRTFSFRAPWKHPSGFQETIFLHFPYDTFGQLASFRPDVIVSAEFGFRTLSALLYRLVTRRSKLVIWATLSEETEERRWFVRTLLRKFIIRFADAIFTNGRSGIRYLQRFDPQGKKFFGVPQTTEVAAFAGTALNRSGAAAHRLIYAGRLIERKQVAQFTAILGEWCRANPERDVEFWVAGDGAERTSIEAVGRPANLQLVMLGNIDYAALPQTYEGAGALVLPTLADEWGLVVNEAMAAGLPVLGSIYSQAVQDLVEDGTNGWVFRIDHRDEVLGTLSKFFDTSVDNLNTMRRVARETALRLTPAVVVDKMFTALRYALDRQLPPVTP